MCKLLTFIFLNVFKCIVYTSNLIYPYSNKVFEENFYSTTLFEYSITIFLFSNVPNLFLINLFFMKGRNISTKFWEKNKYKTSGIPSHNSKKLQYQVLFSTF